MSKCTERQLEHLRNLLKSKSKKKVLKLCPNHTIKSVCECALNLLQGNIPISNLQKRKLVPHKLRIRKLADKKVPLYRKRKLLQTQRGEGLLSILLPAAITAITSLINGV